MIILIIVNGTLDISKFRLKEEKQVFRTTQNILRTAKISSVSSKFHSIRWKLVRVSILVKVSRFSELVLSQVKSTSKSRIRS